MKPNHSTPGAASSLLVAILLGLASPTDLRADYQSSVLTDGPLAYYPLNLAIDTGTTASDLSGNNNPGTLFNISTAGNLASGPSAFIPNAISFDGASTLVELSGGSNPGLLDFGGAITLEAWVQPANATQGLMNIVAKGYDSSSDYNEITLRANAGNFYGGTYSGTHNVQGVSGGVQSTNWSHLVLSHDGSTWRLFVNGTLVQSSSDSVGALNWSTAPWRIGTGSADGSGRLFAGNIAQVAIYNYGLSGDQALEHFAQGIVGGPAASARPIITKQPQAQSAFLGGSVTFSVSSVSALATTNQWFKNNNPIAGQTGATLTVNNMQPSDVANYRVVVGNDNGTTNSATVALTLLSAGNLLQWTVTGNTGVWDVAGAANWLNLGNNQQAVFNNNDQVLFDDSVGVPTAVTINGPVSPSVITVDSSVNNFTFNNPGPISGPASLVKKGSSTLTILSSASFSGTVNISGGSVYAGNNSFAAVAGIAVTNGGTLDFGGGTLNGNKPIVVSGKGDGNKGALFNSYASYPSESLKLTLAGDATFGASQRWDLASGSQIAGPHHLTLNWAGAGYSEWNTPVIGADVLSITLTNGNFGAKNMDSSFQNPATLFTVSPGCELSYWSGGWNGSLRILSGGIVNLWTAPAAYNGTTITLEENAQWRSWGSSSSDQPINSAVVLNGVAHMVIGDHNMVYTNQVSGPGGFVLDAWNHALVLSASNTYTGPTVIGDGPRVALTGEGSISRSALIFFGGNNFSSVHVDVTGRPDQTLALANGQTLGGIGVVGGNLTVAAGATVAPAGTNTTIGLTVGQNATGILGATGDVTLNGTTVLKLNGNGVSDGVVAAGTLSLGGVLNLQNIAAAPLAVGDSFQVFTAASISGTFTGITPTTPGPGLAWNTSQLSSGIIGVVAGAPQPVINSVTVANGKLIFSGTNGTAGNDYYVVTSTNVAAPLSSWTPVATNAFQTGGAFSVTNSINPATPQRFYLIRLP